MSLMDYINNNTYEYDPEKGISREDLEEAIDGLLKQGNEQT